MKNIRLFISRERKPDDNVIVVRTLSLRSEIGSERSVRIHCFTERQLSKIMEKNVNTTKKTKKKLIL